MRNNPKSTLHHFQLKLYEYLPKRLSCVDWSPVKGSLSLSWHLFNSYTIRMISCIENYKGVLLALNKYWKCTVAHMSSFHQHKGWKGNLILKIFFNNFEKKILQHWNVTINSYHFTIIWCFVLNCFLQQKFYTWQINWNYMRNCDEIKGKLLKIKQVLILNENLIIRFLLVFYTEFKATAFFRTRSYQHWKSIQNALKRYCKDIDKTFKMHWTIIGKALQRGHT